MKNILDVIFNRKGEYDRPSFDESFMAIARVWRYRSTCVRTKVGACLVKNNRVIATGYNGRAKGLSHCTKDDCLKNRLNIKHGTGHEYCDAIHAEANCLLQVSENDRKDAILYCTHLPCMNCASIIVQSQIKEVHYIVDYPNSRIQEYFETVGIKLIKHDIDLEENNK